MEISEDGSFDISSSSTNAVADDSNELDEKVDKENDDEDEDNSPPRE